MKDIKQKLSYKNSDEYISDEWCCLEKVTEQEICLSPGDDLNKQIIAAAQREILSPIKSEEYQISWWRKLSLPLYVAAGFTFSVFAFKSMWPAPLYQAPSKSTVVEIQSELENGPETFLSQPDMTESERIKRELPELSVAPESVVFTQKEPIIMALEPSENSKFAAETKIDKIYTGSPLSKATYPEKEAWVRKIIDFMRNGETESARTELTRFKRAYPYYPIEEQIKVLIR